MFVLKSKYKEMERQKEMYRKNSVLHRRMYDAKYEEWSGALRKISEQRKLLDEYRELFKCLYSSS